MVFIPPPHASGLSPSYGEAYNSIIAAHRRSHLTSASSVTILVAPDVDALCAARMLADLFKQDDVMHRFIPISAIDELEMIKDELAECAELHTLILLNMGGILDLPSAEWFGEFSNQITVHVIDSTRPLNLSSLFGTGDSCERIVIWDDGEAAKLQEERVAWEALSNDPGVSDSEDDSELEDDHDDEDEYEEFGGKRRSLGERSPTSGKRRKTDPNRLSSQQREEYARILEKHYSGTWYGQSAAGIIYMLATVLERVDNELLWQGILRTVLWCADDVSRPCILGLTYQYITSRISRSNYEKYQGVYSDEVARLNPIPMGAKVVANPDDSSIRSTEELRFTLFKHWNLYDAMLHSSYVASRLGIWKERGRKRLTGLLAKMGFSVLQTQQPYQHMDMDLKQALVSKLSDVAPEYGLIELTYPSFARCFGYRSQPLSAADAIEAVSALLDIAGGTKMEIEIEGARNGGEWFGSGRVWTQHRDLASSTKPKLTQGTEFAEGEEDKAQELPWWINNFWSAFDALNDINKLQPALGLAMSVHRAIIRQGTAIIDNGAIKTMRHHRVVVLTQGPDLHLFSNTGVLSRLALWLVDALRDRFTGVKRKGGERSLPFVVACANEKAGTFLVVGVMAALEHGDVRKNEFGLAFLDAKEKCNARTRHGSFDTSIVEINKDDLQIFLETLCEAPDY